MGEAERVEARLRLRVVDPLGERAAVLEGRPEVRVGHEDLEAVAAQVELVDHDAVEQADDVRARADDVARVGERALERARAAEPLAPLEHEDGLAGAGEVGRAREPVVAAADDHGVPLARGQLGDRRGQADLSQPRGDRSAPSSRFRPLPEQRFRVVGVPT